jgi:hypothetical protein
MTSEATTAQGYSPVTPAARPRPAPPPDEVTRPQHYTATAVEPLDVIEAWGLGYHLGNVVKYIARAGRKGDALLDLQKARQYLDRYIQWKQATSAKQ